MLYTQLVKAPFLMLTISDLLATFGAFLAEVIATEIFVNIIIYLRDDVIHVKIVLATALLAIARKVIIVDSNKIAPDYISFKGTAHRHCPRREYAVALDRH